MNRRDEAVDFVRVHTAAYGYPPTFREVGAHVGVRSPSTAQELLRALRDEGRVAWEPRQPRTLRVVA